ncbi:F-box domain containing protein [Tanacetum coccineum]
MSDNIPFDIQIAIMNRLPVKSLLQFRTVSKQWKFSIDNFDFIHENLAFRHLDSNLNILSLTPVASSKGVWCFAYGENSMLLLWNPSIKKSVGISVPNYMLQPSSPKMTFGFGIRIVTLDPTLVKINYPLYRDGLWSLGFFTSVLYFPVRRLSYNFWKLWFRGFSYYYAWALEVEGGFVSSCRLLFTIPHTADHHLKLLGFSNDKEPIVEATIVQQWYRSLQVFHSTIEYFQNIDVEANRDSIFIRPYKESLILHTKRNNEIIY